MRRLLFAILGSLVALHVTAQEWNRDELVDYIMQNMVSDEQLSDDGNEAEELYELAENPIDLNSCSDSDLRRLCFLNEGQIKSFLMHREILGHIETYNELLTVYGFSSSVVTVLKYFSYIGNPAGADEVSVRAKANLLARAHVNLPQVRGLCDSIYAGGPVACLVRGRVDVNRFSAGFTLESDIGEPIFKHNIRGTDFKSGYLSYSGDEGVLNGVVLGHYTVRVGQGLGIWSGFNVDFANATPSVCRVPYGIRATQSSYESNYMRGAGVTLRRLWTEKGRIFSFLAYGSNVPIDATKNVGRDSVSAIKTIVTTGYHRTPTELAKRHNAYANVFGAYTMFAFQPGTVGVGANTFRTSEPIVDTTELYKHFLPAGRYVNTFHADYNVLCGSACRLYGELAYQHTHAADGVSFMQAADINLGAGNMLTLAYRNFSRHYTSYVQRPHSSKQTPSGEHGIYAALLVEPCGGLQALLTVDMYKLPFVTYHKDFLLKGARMRLRLSYNAEKHQAYVLLRHTISEQDSAGLQKNKAVYESRRTSVKLSYLYGNAGRFTWRNEFEYVYSRPRESHGFWFSSVAKVNTPHVDYNVVAAYFHTTDADSRIYTNMPDVLYSVSIPSFSGEGLYLQGMLKLHWRLVNVWLQSAFTKYTDGRGTIGSGYQQIEGDYRFVHKLQVQFKISGAKRKAMS